MGKPAAKQGDKIVATDTHILMIPSPGGPVPTPTPMPFNGMITTGVSTDVFIEGKPAAVVNSVAINQPIHIPAGGPFQKPPMNQGKIMIGSTGVFINAKPAARSGDMALTCNDPVDMPIGQVVAMSKVFIGETGAGAPKPPSQPPKGSESSLGGSGQSSKSGWGKTRSGIGGSNLASQMLGEGKLTKARWGQPGEISNAKWEKSRVKCGEAVRALVETEGFEDGTSADFVIWEKDVDGRDDFIAAMKGEVKGNKVTVEWKHSPGQLELDLEREVEEEEGEPEYYFAVDIEGSEARSEILTLTHTLEIYLEDESGKALDDAQYTVTLSDGQKRKGKLKNGKATIEDAPYGEFSIEVEGFYFIEKNEQRAKKEIA